MLASRSRLALQSPVEYADQRRRFECAGAEIPGPNVAVLVEGFMSPLWPLDGREIFFIRGDTVLAAAMSFAPAPTAARPVPLFDGANTLDLLTRLRAAARA